jgi:hypothetical protein
MDYCGDQRQVLKYVKLKRCCIGQASDARLKRHVQKLPSKSRPSLDLVWSYHVSAYE